MTQMSLDLMAVEVEPCLSKEDIFLAHQLVESTPAFLGGSYLTNPSTANDIDLVIAESEYFDYQEDFWQFFQVPNSSEEYTGIHEIAWTERFRGLNLLIVKDMFIPAYIEAAERMQKSPGLYQTRQQRVNLHQKLKNIIRSQNGIDLVQIVE
jgi:hypothetical protein